ncbi:MAG TPA: hypothetical protein PKD09_23770 [Aggregatilinea sp.]|jgi:hypothetical protein|uniref:hypothetical protein n=1 Tax=Aggregatilinea sp. TaxID=2806333 RepID=UPI002B6FF463|nr:hypothetical protein [Aggregatilinea sp.]HML24693.1 hypothetical protein [Aggregatilinea sp.]
MTDNLPVVSNWKGRSYLLGAIGGLALGLLSAYLFVRSTEDKGKPEPSRIGTMDVVRLGVALLAIARQIADLASDD